MAETDTCAACGRTKARAEFSRGHRKCKACVAERQRERYRDQVAADPDFSRRRNYARFYGLTLDEADAILARGCELAGIGACGGRLIIDHDHETGAVRGCLCDYHNGWISRLESSPADAMERVRAYIGRTVKRIGRAA